MLFPSLILKKHPFQFNSLKFIQAKANNQTIKCTKLQKDNNQAYNEK